MQGLSRGQYGYCRVRNYARVRIIIDEAPTAPSSLKADGTDLGPVRNAMSLAVLRSRALAGMDAPSVSVEVHLANGLPQFEILARPV